VTGDELERKDVRATIDRIYQTKQGAAGCCLHVVVDDGNYHEGAVDVVVEAAQKSGHLMCQLVARFLQRLTPEERRSFLRVRR
jgi:hypothetical protein